MINDPPDTHSTIEHRLVWLTRLLGAGVLALIAVTWKLWTPQEVFPRVPLFRWAPPDWWDWASLALILAGGVGLLIRPQRHVRSLAATLALGLAIAFVCDQHRLQPWAWQFFILALLIALADDALLWTGWQWLTISIYFYSALSKFDTDFYTYASAQLEHYLSDRLAPLGVASWLATAVDQFFWERLVRLCPIGELLIAILLTFRRGRPTGVILAVMMHVFLMTILGPYGLHHSHGVVLWNIWFLGLIASLFGMPWIGAILKPLLLRLDSSTISSEASEAMPTQIAPSWTSWNKFRRHAARAMLAFVLLWPATMRWGWCDPWIGWGVYVPFKTPVFIEVDMKLIAAKSASFSQPVWWKAVLQREYYFVSVGEWSLVAMGVPEYPHVRFRMATALDVAEKTGIDQVRVNFHPPPRWNEPRWNKHYGRTLDGVHEIKQYCDGFWFNAYPTSMYRRAAREKLMSDDG